MAVVAGSPRRHAGSQAAGWPNWKQPELLIADRYARAVVRGQYRTTADAVEHCRATLRQAGFRRTAFAIHIKLRERSQMMGNPPKGLPWSATEDRVLRRFARAFVEGRQESAADAARACQKALRSRQARPFSGVMSRLLVLAHDWGVPASRFRWMGIEDRIVDRHARRVLSGRTKSFRQATRACVVELRRLHEQLKLKSPVRLRTVPGRRFEGVNTRLVNRAHELGYRGPRRRSWNRVEVLLLDKWLRRYEYYRSSKSPWSLSATAASLYEDIGAHGFRRTFIACKTAVRKTWHRLHPRNHPSDVRNRQGHSEMADRIGEHNG